MKDKTVKYWYQHHNNYLFLSNVTKSRSAFRLRQCRKTKPISRESKPSNQNKGKYHKKPKRNPWISKLSKAREKDGDQVTNGFSFATEGGTRWEGGLSFLDRPQGEVKRSHYNPRLLLTLHCKLHCKLHCLATLHYLIADLMPADW